MWFVRDLGQIVRPLRSPKLLSVQFARGLAKSPLADQLLQLGHKDQFPDKFWRKVKAIAKHSEAVGNTDPSYLLTKLFIASGKGPLRMLVGNLMLQKGLRLPLLHEKSYIHALVKYGHSSKALGLWSTRKFSDHERILWLKIGMLCHCWTRRMARAEQLVEELQRLTGTQIRDTSLIFALIEGYSSGTSSNNKRLEHWVKLFACGAGSEAAQKCLHLLKQRKKYPSVDILTRARPKADRSVGDGNFKSTSAANVARAIAEHPHMLDSTELVSTVLDTSINSKAGVSHVALEHGATHHDLAAFVLKCLAKGELNDATRTIDILESCGYPVDILVLERCLDHAIRQNNRRLARGIFNKITKHPDQTAKPQFYSRVAFLWYSGRYEECCSLIRTASTSALSKQAARLCWRFMLAMANRKSLGMHMELELPDMQVLFVKMVEGRSLGLDEKMFRLMLRASVATGNVDFAAYLLKYMVEIAGIGISPSFTLFIANLGTFGCTTDQSTDIEVLAVTWVALARALYMRASDRKPDAMMPDVLSVERQLSLIANQLAMESTY